MEILVKPVHRVHMVDAKRQVLDEQSRMQCAASEVLAWIVVLAAIGFGVWAYLGWLGL